MPGKRLPRRSFTRWAKTSPEELEFIARMGSPFEPAKAANEVFPLQLCQVFLSPPLALSRKALTCASVHSSHRITGTSLMPSFFAAFRRRWPSTTSP